MRCAILEYAYYHDEILPSLVYYLNRLGYAVDIYTPQANIDKNVFIYATDLNYRFISMNTAWYGVYEKYWKFMQYDFILLNSLHSHEVLHRFLNQGIHRPTLAVLHNTYLLRWDKEFLQFFTGSANRKPLALAEHVAESISDILPTEWIAPVYYGAVPTASPQEPGTVFCVQGNIEFMRKNYESVVDAVDSLVAEGISGFRVSLIGAHRGENGLILQKTIKERRLEDYFSFSSGFLNYQDYYRAIAEADFLMPLIDTSFPHFYFREKISSTLPLAVGLGKIPILHQRLAKVYGLEVGGFLYETGFLHVAMKAALTSDVSVKAAKTNYLLEKRQQQMAISQANLAALIHSLGVKRP